MQRCEYFYGTDLEVSALLINNRVSLCYLRDDIKLKWYVYKIWSRKSVKKYKLMTSARLRAALRERGIFKGAREREALWFLLSASVN